MSGVWIDGRLVAEPDAHVPAVSPGVQIGMGVFESLVVIGGVAFALTRHLARLAASAAIVGVKVPVSDADLRDAVAAVVAANPGANKLRITVSSTGVDTSPVVVVNAVTQPEWPDAATIVVSPYVRNERAASVGAKTTGYLDNALARQDALGRGAGEAVLCDSRGFLSEGTASNVFCVVDDVLCTPSFANGCLAGVTRELLCEVAEVHERDDLTPADLRAAPEVFITSSTRGVHPVATVDGVAVEQCPGPLTAAAGAAFEALVARTLDP